VSTRTSKNRGRVVVAPDITVDDLPPDPETPQPATDAAPDPVTPPAPPPTPDAVQATTDALSWPWQPEPEPTPQRRRAAHPSDEFAVIDGEQRKRGFVTREEAEFYASSRPGATVRQVGGPEVESQLVASDRTPSRPTTPEASPNPIAFWPADPPQPPKPSWLGTADLPWVRHHNSRLESGGDAEGAPLAVWVLADNKAIWPLAERLALDGLADATRALLADDPAAQRCRDLAAKQAAARRDVALLRRQAADIDQEARALLAGSRTGGDLVVALGGLRERRSALEAHVRTAEAGLIDLAAEADAARGQAAAVFDRAIRQAAQDRQATLVTAIARAEESLLAGAGPLLSALALAHRALGYSTNGEHHLREELAGYLEALDAVEGADAAQAG
jgi:hypothetical protein